jgi:hypothetical protein
MGDSVTDVETARHAGMRAPGTPIDLPTPLPEEFWVGLKVAVAVVELEDREALLLNRVTKQIPWGWALLNGCNSPRVNV